MRRLSRVEAAGDAADVGHEPETVEAEGHEFEHSAARHDLAKVAVLSGEDKLRTMAVGAEFEGRRRNQLVHGNPFPDRSGKLRAKQD